MKRIFSILFAILTVASMTVNADSPLKLTKGVPVFIYSLPKMQLCFEIEVERVEKKHGQFYQYSQKYLATDEVITEDNVSYVLKGIRLQTSTIADPFRTYAVENTTGFASNFISVNKQGILCGINMPINELGEKKISKLITLNKPVTSDNILPLGEEYLMAGSTAKLAEGVAKQIYRIRESRMLLLSGDMDELPADGKSLATMLQGLNDSEKTLTEMFTGKITTELITEKIVLLPESVINNQILFRLSALRGIVASDDLSGAPYYISVIPSAIELVPAAPKAKIEKTILNTILPAATKITVSNGLKNVLNTTIEMPQFGVIIPIAERITNMPKIKIAIDPENGRLLKIER